jgi:hypothetical protein
MGNLFDCAQNPLSLPEENEEAIVHAPSSRGFELQAATRLRDSLVWELQRGFYERMSVTAWSESIVPNFVTSNRCAFFVGLRDVRAPCGAPPCVGTAWAVGCFLVFPLSRR